MAKEEILDIDKKWIEKAKKENRFLYVDWKRAKLMLSDQKKTISPEEKARRKKEKLDKIEEKLIKYQKKIEELKG